MRMTLKLVAMEGSGTSLLALHLIHSEIRTSILLAPMMRLQEAPGTDAEQPIQAQLFALKLVGQLSHFLVKSISCASWDRLLKFLNSFSPPVIFQALNLSLSSLYGFKLVILSCNPLQHH